MNLVLQEDFVGQYKISTGRFSANDLQLYIDKFTKQYLLELFGKEFYDLFEADLDMSNPQVPQTQRFLDIYNEFFLDNTLCNYKSDGIRKMLVKLIYFHFKRDEPNFGTVTGQIRNENENATNLVYNGYNLVEAYNEGITDYLAIQHFMLWNTEIYEEVISTHQEKINGY